MAPRRPASGLERLKPPPALCPFTGTRRAASVPLTAPPIPMVITKEVKKMHAGISNLTRKEVYRRDGYRCALCDCTHGLQVHHAIPRGHGGSNAVQNLITLCDRCHAAAHGLDLDGTGITADDMEQMIVEYLSDYYLEHWAPYAYEDGGG